MSGNQGPILPVINVPVNYDEERDKIQDFLEHFKASLAQVPSLADVGTQHASYMPDESPEAALARETDAGAMEIDALYGNTDMAQDAVVNKYMVQLVRMHARTAPRSWPHTSGEEEALGWAW